MKKLIYFFFLFFCLKVFCQIDSTKIKIGERYWEDQLYLSTNYNILTNQPRIADVSGFSYGISTGYIKDFPFNEKGKWAAGIGIGYSFDSFSHNLKIEEGKKLTIELGVTSNKIKLHSLELPIQLRWRNSNAFKYAFWRIYVGIRLSYNLNNKFRYKINNQEYSFSNIPIYNKFQSGIELSAGYSTFNFYAYYGLSPMYKNAFLNKEKINTKILKFGLIFYLL